MLREVEEALARASKALERIPDDPTKQVLLALHDSLVNLANAIEPDATIQKRTRSKWGRCPSLEAL